MQLPKKRLSYGKLIERIKIIYDNYGIDISTMDEDELKRIAETYSLNIDKLEQDIAESEKHKDKFLEDII